MFKASGCSLEGYIGSACPNIPLRLRRKVANALRLSCSDSFPLLSGIATLNSSIWYSFLSSDSMYSNGIAQAMNSTENLTQSNSSMQPSQVQDGLLFNGSLKQYLIRNQGLSVSNSTVMVRANFSGSATNGALIKNSPINDNGGWGLGIGNQDFDTPGNQVLGLLESIAWMRSGSFVDGSFYNYEFSCAGNTSYLFVDSKFISYLQQIAYQPSSSILLVGGYVAGSNNRCYTGKIQSVMLFNQVISNAARPWISNFLKIYSSLI